MNRLLQLLMPARRPCSRDNRRDFLRACGGLAVSSVLPNFALGDRPQHRLSHLCGWLPSEESHHRFIKTTERPYFSDWQDDIRGTGAGKHICLWPYYEKAIGGPLKPYLQKIGDCGGVSGAMTVDFLMAIQIHMLGRRERWMGRASSEIIYAGSRVEVGEGVIRRGDGTCGVWVAEWLRDYGVVLRDKYGNIDLTNYRPDLARAYGKRGVGVPDELEKLAKLHPVQTISIVRTVSEARDLLQNGHPFFVAGKPGCTNECDSDGFLKRGKDWWHFQTVIGYEDRPGKRPGFVNLNSWGENWPGKWVQHELKNPAGSYAIDPGWMEEMLDGEDCFALSNYHGYPKQDLDYRMI